jgi:hypothetical protein
MKLEDFSIALGFHRRCILDPKELAKKHHYDQNSWWSAISNEPVSSKNSIVSIHNPTLRFLAKWLAMVVHPHADLCLCSLPELQYLYAMAKQIRCSPVRTMLAHWQKMISGKSPIDMTSLITRIARYIGVMNNAEVTFMPEIEAFRYEVSLEHFVQGHMMREALGNSIFMCYPWYDREIKLPCPRLSLHGEKPNLADGEGAHATKCCRSTDKKQNPTGPTSRSRTITSSTPSSYYCAARTFYTEHELRRSLWVLCLWQSSMFQL